MNLGAQSTGVHVEATKYPPCACGHAFAAHCCEGWHPVGNEPCTCRGYQPHGRIEWLGLRAKSYPAGMAFGKRLACQALWAVEKRIQGWRERLERR